MNKYASTKAIRFKLIPQNNALQEEVLKLNSSSNDSSEMIAGLAGKGKTLSSQIQQYLFIVGDDDKRRLNPKIEIKERWLKIYTKQYYYDCKMPQSNTKSYKIIEIYYLKDQLEEWLEKWNENIEILNKLLNNPDENKAQRAEYALLISQVRQRQNFLFIKDFIDYSQDKSTDQLKEKLTKTCQDFAEILAQCEQQYLPAQTSGVVIARASFNYYTVNKKPIDYAKEQKIIQDEFNNSEDLDDFKKMMENHWQNRLTKKEAIQKHQTDNAEVNKDISALQQNLDNLKNLTLNNAYSLIKQYKAEAKSEFNEACYSDKGVDLIQDAAKYPLFLKDMDTDERKVKFEKFVKNTKTITTRNKYLNKLNQNKPQNKTKIREIKQEIKQEKKSRGEYFNAAIQYKKLVKEFKVIAMKKGKITAQLRGIEKEKIESQLLNYWALILQQQQQHFLLLVPKEQMQPTRALLEKNRGSSLKQGDSIHYFKSLTFRALYKLCFGANGNTFARELKNEFPKEYNDLYGAFSLEKIQPEVKKVQFYQAVLTSNFVKNNLDIHDFNGFENVVTGQFESIESFRKALEKVCYHKQIIVVDSVVKELKQNAQLFEISSYDLKKDKSRKGLNKEHTSIWFEFWSNENQQKSYPTRLNPEIKISWRDAKQSRIKKYGKGSANYDTNKNNRYLEPQFTLTTTITQNATGDRMELAFTNQDELAEQIKKFNQDFNQEYLQNPNDIYYYGIDRGMAELATLTTVAKFSKNKNKHNQPTASFAKFNVWRLKDITYKESHKSKGEDTERHAIKNISYFIDNEALFEHRKTSSIDLTCAKLIKGKIVENGDVMSYLKLKELSAKRRIYEYFSAANIAEEDNPIYFQDTEFRIKTKDNNSRNIIYYFRVELAEIKSQEDIETMLNNYLNQLQIKKY